MNLGAVEPAAAATARAGDPVCATFGSSFALQAIEPGAAGLRLGCARDAGDLAGFSKSDDDLVAAIDFNITLAPEQWLRTVNDVVASVNNDIGSGMALSQALTLRAQRDSVGVFTQTDDVWFGGSIQAVGHTVVLTVDSWDVGPAGSWEVGTAGFWDAYWKKFVTGLVALATTVLVGGVCLAAFNVGAPAAAPVCGAVSGGLGAGVGELVSAALDGKRIDRSVAGAAIGSAMAGAITGALAGALLQYLSAGTRGLLVGVQTTLRRWAAAFKIFRSPLTWLAGWIDADTRSGHHRHGREARAGRPRHTAQGHGVG